MAHRGSIGSLPCPVIPLERLVAMRRFLLEAYRLRIAYGQDSSAYQSGNSDAATHSFLSLRPFIHGAKYPVPPNLLWRLVQGLHLHLSCGTRCVRRLRFTYFNPVVLVR